jgi:DNA mismatch repair protein MutS
MDVRDTDGEIVFLKRVRQGPSSNSYGIHVARLAGLPHETIQLAERLLEEESIVSTRAADSTEALKPAPRGQVPARQEQLFSQEEMAVRQIAGLEIDLMTPMEALTFLARLKRELSEGKAP